MRDGYDMRCIDELIAAGNPVAIISGGEGEYETTERHTGRATRRAILMRLTRVRRVRRVRRGGDRWACAMVYDPAHRDGINVETGDVRPWYTPGSQYHKPISDIVPDRYIYIDDLIAAGNPVSIISGEGERGVVEPHTGSPTRRAIRARLSREQCGGDRWAYAMVYDPAHGEGINVETGDDITWYTPGSQYHEPISDIVPDRYIYIAELIAAGNPVIIISGKGERGVAEPHTGRPTRRAILARLTRERRGGARWARALVYDPDPDYAKGVNIETGMDEAMARTLMDICKAMAKSASR